MSPKGATATTTISQFSQLSTSFKVVFAFGILAIIFVVVLLIVIFLSFYTDLIPLSTSATIDDLKEIDLSKYNDLFGDPTSASSEREEVGEGGDVTTAKAVIVIFEDDEDDEEEPYYDGGDDDSNRE